MKFINYLFFYLLFWNVQAIADPLVNKNEIIRNANQCFYKSQSIMCKKLILQVEKLQLSYYEKKNYKCQSSLLGFQTELIERLYSKNGKNNKKFLMIPYVIKNC